MNEDFFETIRQTLTDTAEVVGKKTEEFVETQKLRNKVRVIRRNIQNGYEKLGEALYQKYTAGEEIEEDLKRFCEEIKESQKELAACKEDIAQKQGKNQCPVCKAANPKTAAFCMQCGAELPHMEEPVEDWFADATEEVDEPHFEEDEEAEENAKQESLDAEQEVWDACAGKEDEDEE